LNHPASTPFNAGDRHYDNGERRHSTIDYLSPIVDEQQFFSSPKLTPA
jgi:hypothetical protein